MKELKFTDVYTERQLGTEFPLIHAIKSLDYGNRYMPVLIELAYQFYKTGALTEEQVALFETICDDQDIPLVDFNNKKI